MIDAIMRFAAAQGIPYPVAAKMSEMAMDDLELWERRGLWALYSFVTRGTM